MIEEIFEETEIKEITTLTDAGYPDLDVIQRLETQNCIVLKKVDTLFTKLINKNYIASLKN